MFDGKDIRQRVLDGTTSWIERWYEEIETSGVQIIMTGAGIVTGVLTARGLGVSGKGALAAVYLWPSVVEMFAEFGVQQAVVHEVGSNKQDTSPKVAKTSLYLGVIQGLAGTALGIPIVRVVLEGYGSMAKEAAVVMFLWMPCRIARSYLVRVIHGQRRIRKWNTVRLSHDLVYALGVFGLWAGGSLTVRSVIFVFIAGQVVSGAIATFSLRDHLLDGRASLSLARRLVQYGYHNVRATIASRATDKLDHTVIAYVAEPTTLGLYKIADSTARVVAIAGSGFQRVIIARTADTSLADFKETLKSSLTAVGILGTATAVIAVAAIPIMIPLVFGDEYSGSIVTAQILAVAMLLYTVKETLFNGFLGAGKPEVRVKGETMSIVVMVSLVFPALLLYGIEGVAIVTGIAYLGAVWTGLVWLRGE